MQDFDVIIIGAGLMGSFTAKHLASRGYRIAVLERENDVSMGISRANTAIVYAGYDMKPGTLKARLTVSGNAAFGDLCKELGVPFERTGSLMLAAGPRGQKVLEDKLQQGLKNNVPALRLLEALELQSLNPGVSSAVSAALYAPTTGTVNPWQLCLAAARSAKQQGASFFFEHEVVAIEPGFIVTCLNGSVFGAPVVVNCAGIEADLVSELVAPVSFRLSLSSGSYVMLDEGASASLPLSQVVFFEPEIRGKGATFVPTTDGTLLLGPSEDDVEQASCEPGYPTEHAGLEFVRSQSLAVFPELPLDQTIRSFGTLRPSIHWAESAADGSVNVSAESIHDFYIAWAEGCPGFLNVAGIKTPGLTCADGIGAYVADMVQEGRGLVWYRRDGVGVPLFAEAKSGTPTPSLLYHPVTLRSDSEILCRCRQVTYGEARAAIRAELGARSVDGLKRRVGCGLGRCQSGFCMDRVMLLLAEELGCKPTDIIKDRSGSWIARERGTPNPVPPVPLPRLLIVGAGAAGLAAASAANEAGIAAEDILLVDRLDATGGILNQCTHRGFGNKEHGGTLSGQEFLATIYSKFSKRNIPTLLNTMVTSISPTRSVSLATPEGLRTLEPEAIVFATGCRERPIGTLPIAGTRPSGIFTAGAAQRMVNLLGWDIGERIVILGSGDVGMVMAETLSQQGKQVLALVEQAADATGLKANRERYVDANNIPLITNSTITRVYGHRRIEGVAVEQRDGVGVEQRDTNPVPLFHSYPVPLFHCATVPGMRHTYSKRWPHP